MLTESLIEDAKRLLEELRALQLRLATAESCTGGLIAAALTEVPESSVVVDRGFVTYCNAAKTEMLGVPAELIALHGAVSSEVAIAMARGALLSSSADIAVAVTGVAGPGGGTAAKPVGLVHIAAARMAREAAHRECRFGDIGRHAIRQAATVEAFALVRKLLVAPVAGKE